MEGISLELPDGPSLLVHIGSESTGALAVKASGRYDGVGLLLLFRPCFGFVLFPMVPLFHGREFLQVRLGHPVQEWLTFSMQIGDESHFLRDPL